MQLSPEERHKIYEEEKARIEAEPKQRIMAEGSTTGLEPNIAGLLCYLAGWITGIIFLILEQKNQFVRFHALQSIITFGILTVASGFLGWIPFVGGFFRGVIGIVAFILWIVLMVKAYHGELYKVSVIGDVAEGIMPVIPVTRGEPKTTEPPKAPEKPEPPGPPQPAIAKKAEEFGKRLDNYFTRSRAGRITGYSAAIFWNVALFIFSAFFHQYIAWYHIKPDGDITRLSMLTNEYFAWLPILLTALTLSTAANIFLIIYDRYWLREIIQVILSIIGIVVVVNLVSIFPFDFSVIPNTSAVYFVPVVVTIVLILIAIGLGVGALVQLIKLIVHVTRQSLS